jgi:hypothetical protein
LRSRAISRQRKAFLVDLKRAVALTYGGFFPALDESAEKPRG